MNIYLATGNSHKVRELQAMLEGAGLDIVVHSAEELGGMPEVGETESTFEGNAQLKCLVLQNKVPEGAWILSDDSGLSVEALKGAPGVHSARYAGEEATDEENRAKLMEALAGVPEGERGAKFMCCFVLYHPSVGEVVFLSSVKGRIVEEANGESGFGYDPLFVPNNYEKTFAQMSAEEKNAVSHRGVAVKQMVEWFRER